MKQVSLKVQSRSELGRGPSRRQRQESLIPAVIYGRSGVRHLTIEKPEWLRLWKAVAGRTALVELQAEAGEPMLSIIQDVQRDSRTDHFVHIDFKEIERGREMVAQIRVQVVGEAYGVKTEGGLVEIRKHEVGVRCRPRHLPEQIVIDVTALRVGQSVHTKDLPVLEGVTYTDHADVVIVACSGKSAGEAAEEAAPEAVAAAEPAKAAPAAAKPAAKS